MRNRYANQRNRNRLSGWIAEINRPCCRDGAVVDEENIRSPSAFNGEVRQDDTTDRLTWGFAWLINYISTFATLSPGDYIWTGTPTGAGVHRNPSLWLKPGDVVEVEAPGIGVLRNKVVDEG